ncbi:methyltransferase family protein [Salidesulfovibrio onnuriiensis]|uniref:methyltransferase family protein n=1 Tax=Salidesulfovibrio onnuriiensis TaxID=2583823 RepID=UPI0011CB98F0|nr:isoprenylcysteine carboxylmethyltransferase family protein [Salidesulfovibrio onnuriiensis]
MKYTDKFVAIASEERSSRFKVITLVVGATLFLVVFAWLVLWISHWLVDVFNTLFVEPLPVVGGVIAAIGAAVAGWTALVMWMQAEGTPAPLAPTRKLVVSGPFRYCRNPMQLGMMIYLLGLGTAFFSLVTGLVALLVAFAVGGSYHHFIEEKELRARFGEEYEQYRRGTPFLIPRCKRAGGPAED